MNLYKEEQTYRNWEWIVFIGVLVAGLGYGFITGNIQNASQISPMWAMASLMALSFFLFYLLNVRMRFAITEKSINYQYFPLHYKKQKIKIEDVDYCAVVDNPSLPSTMNGSNLSFATQEKMFSVCGRKGLDIRLKNGDRVFLGSKNAKELQSAITKCIDRTEQF